MQVSDDLRKAVVFIGQQDQDGHFKPFGTAFLAQVEQCSHLVTNRHISDQLGNGPFLIRLNRNDGTSHVIHVDSLDLNTKWFHHPSDRTVDIAVLFFNRDTEAAGYDTRVIDEGVFANDNMIRDGLIGPGDACHAIGLFHLMAGRERNLPVVHTGNIALTPGQERVPVMDWLRPGQRRDADAYLVEMSNLKGLSGSPVFVRISFVHQTDHEGVIHPVRMAHAVVFLLGVWQSSWDGPAELEAFHQANANVRIPLGMGVVAPVQRLAEIFDRAELKALRQAELARRTGVGAT